MSVTETVTSSLSAMSATWSWKTWTACWSSWSAKSGWSKTFPVLSKVLVAVEKGAEKRAVDFGLPSRRQH